MEHSRFGRVVAALAALVGAVAGVWAQSPLPSPDEQQRPNELIVAFNALDLEFDPHHSIYSAEAQIFTATYEGLFSYNPNTLDAVKAACRSYTRTQDGRTYTFYIRDEATWSDGSALLAKDFRDAWLHALSPAEKADYAAFFDIIAGARDFRLGKNADPASVGISVIAEKILQVKLEGRADYFTRLLCHHSFSPVHPSMMANSGWKGISPIPVNGPYRFASSTAEELILVANEKYWDAASLRIPRIRVLLSDDDVGVTRRFDNGEIHWLAGPVELDALLDRPAIQVNPMFGTHYWFFSAGAKPWSDPELRRALALMLPWEAIRSKELYTIPASTLVLPFQGYQKAKGISKTDEDEATKLLEKAGFAGGKGLPTLVILAPDGEDAKRVGDLMKSAWERLPGLHVEVKVVPAAHYFDLVRAGPEKSGYNLALTTWIGDFADPLAFLQMWRSDSNLNDAGLADAEFDRLLDASTAKEGEERLAALAEAETRLLYGAAVLPIYHSVAVNVIDTDFVTGWYANALDIHPFKYIDFGERRIRPNVAFADGLPLAAGMARR